FFCIERFCLFGSLLMHLICKTALLISALLRLESIILSMYIALAIQPFQVQSSASTILLILIPTFSGCKAGTGLALLVASTRTHGSDHLHNLNLLQC
ncbi:NU4LM oxidoreductase, partial [Pheucticus melanocephalus]|nr:NU4LM oxidoreductase [Pheucticus melanocephalus]